MPPATRMRVIKQRVAVALRPALVAAAVLALAPQAAPAAPVASFVFSPPAPLTNEQVTFVSTSTGGNTPEKWDLDGDRLCDDAVGPVVVRSFWPAGAYAVTVCVGDGIDEATLMRRFTVRNRPPEAAIAFAPTAPMSGETIALASTSADPDGPIVSQSWDLDGDGEFDDAIGATAAVSFEAPGKHPVGLLVTDRDGAAGAATVAIPVAAPPPEPITPFPVVRMAGSFGVSGIRIQQLVVRAPRGARVRIDCRGRGCPFHRMVRRPRSETIRVRRFAGHVLRPKSCLLYTSPSPRDGLLSRMPSSA